MPLLRHLTFIFLCVLQSSLYALPAQAEGSSAGQRRLGGAYGAIAYDDQSATYGLSDASADRDSARKNALHYCSRRGQHCRVVETFSGTCAAVAQNSQRNVAAWAKNDSRRQVAEDAKDLCNKKAGSGKCHVILLHCYK